jgi:G3E family GTPase
MTDAAPAADSLLPITILTGFLGSGKTTLLSKLIRHPGMARTAVIINEFGEVGLDHLLIESSNEDTLLLDGGCLCCTVRSDLVETLRSLAIRRVRGEVIEFERVVIETTGLADPAPIIHALIMDPMVAARFRLDGVIATVDAVNGYTQLGKHFESVKQAAVADRIVLTKVDLAEGGGIARLRERLGELNPGASIVPARMGEIDPLILFDTGLWDASRKTADVRTWLHEEAYRDDHDHHEHDHDHDHDDGHHHHHDPNRHDGGIQSFVLYFDQPLPWERWAAAFDDLVTREGARLLRIKGLLNVIEEERPVVIHGVQHLFHPPSTIPAWPDADRRSRIVFITHEIDREEVSTLLDTLLIAAPERVDRL